MQRVLLLAVVIPLAFAAVRPVATPSFEWWTANSLSKIRPNDMPPETVKNPARLYASRNEFESFQAIFRAEGQNIQNADIEMSDLKSPDGGGISKANITVYFERYLDLPQPSSVEGAAGEWPDALIPRVDRYAKEKRNAFPFHLTSGRNQPIWVEIYVPPQTPPGNYDGKVSFQINGKIEAIIPLSLKVWNFTLPSTPSFPTTFGFNGLTAVRQHFGKYTTDADVKRFTALYRKAALWHRISLHGGSMIPPSFSFTGDQIEVDWTDYDSEVAPFLDGHAIPSGEPLYGAQATTICMRTPPTLSNDEQKVLYWKAVAIHFRDKGWFSRLFNYLLDEPKPEDFDDILHEAQLVHKADSQIRNLVTAPLHKEWSGAIDIWTPLINCFELKPSHGEFCDPMVKRSAYEDEIAKGVDLWWYQSCASHGCSIVGGEYHRGWPSYMIDAGGVSNRIMPWLAWKYDIRGELYYNIDEIYSRKKDAWNDVYLFGGNGDGTLVYPGRPKNIGGKTDIPIESIRLKLIRDGLEDYEYLKLLSRHTNVTTVKNLVDTLVTNTYTFEKDPAKVYEVRRVIGEKLDQVE
jgi:Glycoside hydrolase 123, catalytic domain/Glycoside hydrolase 123 N-terminal domain